MVEVGGGILLAQGATSTDEKRECYSSDADTTTNNKKAPLRSGK